MKNAIRKALNAGCMLALSSALLCSCSAPAASDPVILTNAAAQNVMRPEMMSVRRSAQAEEPAPESAAPSAAAQDITPVSAMDIMCHPSGAVRMEDGSLLVADVYNNVIWHVADGTSTVYAGSYTKENLEAGTPPIGGYNDASYADSLFSSPWAMAPFLDGFAVSDTGNHVIRLLQNGEVRTVNARTAGGTADTTFEHPTGLAGDDLGNLYVADTFADTIYRITPEGVITTEVTGVSEPMGMCWYDGSLYVAESGHNRIVSVRDGEITVIAGSGEEGNADGAAGQASFASPQGVASGSDGTVYVADTDNSAVRVIRDGQVSTLYSRDVRDLEAFFPISPVGMLTAGSDLYICDPFARALLALPLAD